jgi:hypothetical protein
VQLRTLNIRDKREEAKGRKNSRRGKEDDERRL